MKLGRNDDCWCGSGKKYKKCHLGFDSKIEQAQMEGMLVPDRKLLKTPDQVEKIRQSARINTGVLDHVAERIQPGMTTAQIDKLVYEYTVGHG
ncbi:MAG: SEC-C metal-binding domain-containing protein, partial [Massilioclostridium sp.]|nr:SEC-C metal-binding domain-containing protein [Massilioclostridium sp.]